jgi:Protein of unknown function (DUF4031)
VTVCVDDWRQQATIGRRTARWSDLSTGPGGNLDELHQVAGSIGLRRSWFQGSHHHPHYDVTAGKRWQAIRAAAQPVTWRKAGQMLAAAREASRPAPAFRGAYQLAPAAGTSARFPSAARVRPASTQPDGCVTRTCPGQLPGLAPPDRAVNPN